MSEIKIFVTHTPNRVSKTVDNPLLYNIVAGADFNTKDTDYLLDNTGDNISSKNKSYCELTTQYWAWKNMEADYYGFFHYRRFFSFNENYIKESPWGTIEYSHMTEKELKEICLDEKHMRDMIEKYDFIIAEGVDVTKFPTPHKNVYKLYEDAVDLHIEDYDLMLKIIDEKYPFLSDAAKKYSYGKILYSCNMYIMKKELFNEYNKILFDILEEFENRADMSEYSREGYRTTGHLGERFAGIYYTYLKEQGKYKTKELQIALFKDVTVQEKHQYIDNAVPIVLAANDYYVPIMTACIQSIVDNISADRIYDCIIFHTDIKNENQIKMAKSLSRDNFKLSFTNVSENVYTHILEAKEHISTETFYRFLILDLLAGYDKVLYLDSDMIIKKDVAELFDTDLGDDLIGAAHDPDFTGQINIRELGTREYCDSVLKLDKPEDYFQAGVLVLNVKELKRVTSVEQLIAMAETGIYKYSDQDILNVVCQNRVKYIDMAWNYIYDCNEERYAKVVIHANRNILDAYEKARKNPYIIHYAGWKKPWDVPEVEYAEEFWNEAKKTPYYELLLYRMTNTRISQALWDAKVYKDHNQKLIPKLYFKMFPEGSKRRAFVRNSIKPFMGKKLVDYMDVPE